uniref:PrsW family intramembrane metalloprotease n=1 Tax=candidate division WOR-3 bacterium TaxID=2052148 RepID=A0A7C4TE50_UNCW3
MNKKIPKSPKFLNYLNFRHLGVLAFRHLLYEFCVFQYGLGTGILRAFLSVPGHAFFGALMGYYIGQAKFNRQK